MNKGEWNGKRLISRDYMEAAVSRRIDSSFTRNDSELQYGYGYQIWRIRNGGFAFNGMGSQLALCVPEHDIILCVTADCQALNNATDNIIGAYFRLIETIKSSALPDNKDAQTALTEKISALSIPLPQGEKITGNAALYSGRRYAMEENEMGLKFMSFDIKPEKCVLNYENKTGAHSITLGMGEYTAQKFPEKYFGMTIGIKDTQYDSIAAGAWQSGDALTGAVYAIDDHIGSIKMLLSFSENSLSVYMRSDAEWFFSEFNGFATGYLC